jgi:NAD(P)-dependent dehydrogenase (short-subunit alcohol dehydrogenase family)
MSVAATTLLRRGLLEEVHLLLAGPSALAPGEAPSTAVASAFLGLGARVSTCVADAEDEPTIDRAVADALAEAGALHILVVDGAALFADRRTRGGGADGGSGADADAAAGGAESEAAHAALRTCLDASWNVTRAVVNGAFLPAERGGRIVYVAPAADAGEHADAARAGLENLARTLSVEWARHAITVVTIAPGDATAAGEVATLCAYLASPAGAYFSGCLLDLRGVGRDIKSS